MYTISVSSSLQLRVFTLELADHFAEFDDPVAQVLLPMGVNLVVGLGDDRERAQA